MLHRPGEPETWFWTGLEWDACCQRLGHLSIAELGGHSAGWLPHRETHIQIRYWLCWKQCSILNLYYLDRVPGCHPHAPEHCLHLGHSSFCPHWARWIAHRSVGLMSSYSGAPEIHVDVRYFTDKHLDLINMWNVVHCIHSIRTYINTTTNFFPTCLLIHHYFIFIKSLGSLSILISSGT